MVQRSNCGVCHSCGGPFELEIINGHALPQATASLVTPCLVFKVQSGHVLFDSAICDRSYPNVLNLKWLEYTIYFITACPRDGYYMEYHNLIPRRAKANLSENFMPLKLVSPSVYPFQPGFLPLGIFAIYLYYLSLMSFGNCLHL